MSVFKRIKRPSHQVWPIAAVTAVLLVVSTKLIKQRSKLSPDYKYYYDPLMRPSRVRPLMNIIEERLRERTG